MDEQGCRTPQHRITRRQSSREASTPKGQVGVLGLPASGSAGPAAAKPSSAVVSHRLRTKSSPQAKKHVNKKKKGGTKKDKKTGKKGKTGNKKKAASKTSTKKGSKKGKEPPSRKSRTAAKSKPKQPSSKAVHAADVAKPAPPKPVPPVTAPPAAVNPDEAETQLLTTPSPALPAPPALAAPAETLDAVPCRSLAPRISRACGFSLQDFPAPRERSGGDHDLQGPTLEP